MKHKKNRPAIVQDPPFDGFIQVDGELMGFWLPEGTTIEDIKPRETERE